MNEGLDFVWRFTLYAIGVMAVMFALALGIFLVVRRNSLKKD
jgi:hypothetical protein